MGKRSLPKKPAYILPFTIIAIIISLIVIFLRPQTSSPPELITYTHPTYNYTLQYPATWKLREVEESRHKGEVEIEYPVHQVENNLINIAVPIQTNLTPMEYDQQEKTNLPPGLIVAPKYWTMTIGNNEWLFFLDEESGESINPLVAYTTHNGYLYRLYLVSYHLSDTSAEMIESRRVFEQVVASFNPGL